MGNNTKKNLNLPASHTKISVADRVCTVALEYRDGSGYYAVINYKLGGKYRKKRKSLNTESHTAAVSNIDTVTQSMAAEIKEMIEEDAKKEALAKTAPEQIYFFDFLDLWFANEKAERQWRYNTVKSNLKYVNCLKKHEWLNKPLSEIKTDDIRKSLNYRRKNGNSENTVAHEYTLLKAVFIYAVDNDYILKNPLNKIKKPNVKAPAQHVLKDEDVFRILNDLAKINRRLYLAAFFGVLFGLRRGEITALRWSNIEFRSSTAYPNGYIKIDKSAINKFDNGEKLFFDEPTKTGKTRVIAMSPQYNEMLQQIKEEEEQNKEVAGNSWKSEWDGYVIRDQIGEIASLDYITGAWMRYRDKYLSEEYGDKIRFHDLRHTAATVIYNETKDTLLVQRTLGHSTIATTMNIYTFFSTEGAAQMMENVSDKLLKCAASQEDNQQNPDNQ